MTLNKTDISNSKNDDAAFETILKRLQARVSNNIIRIMYSAMKTDEENINEFYVVQWMDEPYTLQEDQYMKGYNSLIKD